MSAPLSTSIERRFFRAGWLTLMLIFLVVLAGGIVRATGSGMGCPEWPKCFGQWVPPTSEAQLPADYQTRFNVHGHGVEPFNVWKTWTEYLNRLLGAIAGLAVLGMVFYAIPMMRAGKGQYFVYSIIALLLIGFNGWLGKLVVSSNLAGIMVTIHMLLALVLIFWLVFTVQWTYLRIDGATVKRPNWLIFGAIVALFSILTQIVLGTQLRELLDEIARSGIMRSQWIDQAGWTFIIHRSFSIFIVVVNILLVTIIYRYTTNFGGLYFCCAALYMLLGLEIASGVIMAYFSVPSVMQPVHLLVSMLLATFNFTVLLHMFKYQWAARQLTKAIGTRFQTVYP
jgi:heme a synthase